MARETFVDTSGFYAFLVKRDRMHSKAGDILRKAAKTKAPFVTTDYVLDETATLLKSRGHGHLVSAFLDAVFSSNACAVEWMDPDRFHSTRRFFEKHVDQAWSFTDCFSFSLMKELKIRNALTKDDHFRQAGFNPLLA